MEVLFFSCVTEIRKYLVFSVLIFLAHSHLVQGAPWSEIVAVAPAIASMFPARRR